EYFYSFPTRRSSDLMVEIGRTIKTCLLVKRRDTGVVLVRQRWRVFTQGSEGVVRDKRRDVLCLVSLSARRLIQVGMRHGGQVHRSEEHTSELQSREN